jgi:acrylyl-CoA reductase (NADPH)
MRAIVIEKEAKANVVQLRDVENPTLSDNEVRVAVQYSCMNYKDALVLSGIPGIVREFPMVAGIDFAGSVSESRCDDFSAGDLVVCTGWGLSEDHWGGYAQQACVPGSFLCKLPKGRDPLWAMQHGTAGLTAMMAVMRLEQSGCLKLDGPVIVTGAGGGVGGIAISILSALGHQVCALSGRPELEDYLRALGASELISREQAQQARTPLDTPHWAGIVDNVGGDILAGLLGQLLYNGAAALCGLAASAEYAGNVMPYLLRGITAYGIESVHCPASQRPDIWKRLGDLVDDEKLKQMAAETIGLDQVISYAPHLLAGKIRGRLLVRID